MTGLIQEKIFVRMPSVSPLNSFIRITAGTNDDLIVLEEAMNKIKIEGPSDIQRNTNNLKKDSYTKYTQLESGQNNADFFKYLTYWSQL